MINTTDFKDCFIHTKAKKKFSPHFVFIAYDKIFKKYVKSESSCDYWGEWDVFFDLVSRKEATRFETSYPLNCIKCDTKNSLAEAKSFLECYEMKDEGKESSENDLRFIPIFKWYRILN